VNIVQVDLVPAVVVAVVAVGVGLMREDLVGQVVAGLRVQLCTVTQ
jgi:hypothetical protein